MKPVDQTQFFDKDKGTNGNCQQAALASLLELPLDDVPNFMEQHKACKGHFWELFFDFVRSKGFEPYERYATKDGAPTFRGYYLAYGPSSRGVSHAVVYKDGQLAHDPHPSRDGIKAVETICLLVPLDPARMVLSQ